MTSLAALQDPRIADTDGWDTDGWDTDGWDTDGWDTDGWDAVAEVAYERLAPDPLEVCFTDPARLTRSGALDYLVQLQRLQSRLAALEARAMVVVAGATRQDREVVIVDRASEEERILTLADEAREEIAAALHRSPGTVHDQITAARLLAHALPATRAALEEGHITAAHVRAISEQAVRLSSADDAGAPEAFLADCARLEARVLARAQVGTPAQTRTAARRAVLTIDAQGQERRRRMAACAIDVQVYAEDDGMGVLLARMPLAQAMLVHAALDAAARQAAGRRAADPHAADPHAAHATGEPIGTPSTLGQHRVAALLELVFGPHPDGAVSVAPVRPGVEISVVMDARSLLGVADLPVTIIGVLGGPGAAGAQEIRELLADPRIPVSLRRLVRDPVTGHLLDRGRRSYEVVGQLREYLISRDQTCRFPGCTRPARRCQVDHAVAWEDGGGSTRDNLGHLCRRHHQLKTHGGWEIATSHDGGGCSWISPDGRRYDVDPPPLVPD